MVETIAAYEKLIRTAQLFSWDYVFISCVFIRVISSVTIIYKRLRKILDKPRIAKYTAKYIAEGFKLSDEQRWKAAFFK